MIIALILMVGDRHNLAVQKIHEKSTVIVTPIQYIVSLPIDIVNRLAVVFSTKKTLMKKNAQLQTSLLLLQAKLQKQNALATENKALHELLWSNVSSKDRIADAKLLAVSSDPFIHQIVLNKGSKQGVYIGQPVFDANGVMGQVVQSTPLVSRVMLVTDSQSAIPIEINRTGFRAIAVGDSNLNVLRLKNVTDTTDVKKGDLLVTSGLGNCYPSGYPVGIVSSVEHKPGKPFADIIAIPKAHLNRGNLVLLIWPEKTKINRSIRKALASKESSHG